jgi:RES domain-containing protein
MLEKLVHTSGHIPRHQVCVTFILPARLRNKQIDPAQHPAWNAEDCLVSRAIGDAWLRSRTSLILLVPSVVFKEDQNVLINPQHPDFTRVQVASIEAVRWDDRLFSDSE